MSALLQAVDRAITSHKLVRPGQSILVAVSGGMDSMVLLRVLNELARTRRCRCRLTVAHFNHHLRGRRSDADERFVRREAERLALPFVSDSADVKTFSIRERISVEVAARRLRHAFLARTASRLRIPTVALAHHADDQVELFFVRLLRGSGNEGLAGMKWTNPSPAHRSVRLIRPFLDLQRQDLANYAREQRVRFREDETNALPVFLRNRIRHELLPLLRNEYQPALDRVLRRVMNLSQAEADHVTAAAERWLSKPDDHFPDLHKAVQRRCVQLQLHRAGVVPDFELIERLRQNLGVRMTLGPDHTAWLDPLGRLHCDATPAVKVPKTSGSRLEVSLDSERGSDVFDGVKVEWQFTGNPGSTGIKHTVGRELFDADKVGSTVLLRHWQAGDRFQPSGLKAAVKLQDLFTNLKIARSERHRLVVASTLKGELFWVEKLRISEGFKVGPATARVLLWRWTRL